LLTRAQKIEQVGELKDKFARATSVYVADYRGLNVPAMNVLRRRIRNEGRGDYEYRVAKNSILRRAADGSRVADIATHFEGPTVIALSYGDPVGLAKILTEFAKDHEALRLRGGMLDGKPVTVAAIGTLATLPSLNALRAKLVGLIQAPATQLARLVSEPGAQLARLVQARRKSLESEGA
jgi:large subunit ribosomal protein L10